MSLHDQDPALYADAVYDACVDFEKVQSLDFSDDRVTSSRNKYVSFNCL